MKTENVPIESISPDPANARSHGRRNLEAILNSLRAFGQQKPIVVDARGIVIAGNGTLEAAKRLGWTEIAIVRTELDPGQATAFGIADNRTGELAEWNDEVLRSLLDTMDDEMLEVLAFDQKEIDAMVPAPTIDLEQDEIPEEIEPRTRPGDLWLLGRHRLLCGDAMSADDAGRLMGEEKAGMGLTDPPYDLEDFGFVDTLEEFTEDAVVLVMLGDPQVQPLLQKTSMVCPRFFVLDTSLCHRTPLGDDAYIQHILIARLHNGNAPPFQVLGDGYRTILKTKYRGAMSDDERVGHDHQKQVETVGGLITHHSKPDDLILDLFMGSGTTMIAAELLERRCYGLEMDPAFCDMIVKRWENLTGETAVLEA